MCRVSQRRSTGNRGLVSTLPQKPAAVLFGPNSELFGSKLHTTTILKPGHAPGFFLPAKGQQWRGFAGGANFDDH